ncbi:MAG: tRNA (adenosine(37)-N6)-dimethylallyltransferase MiaA [Candidatus Babeliales bacterium]
MKQDAPIIIIYGPTAVGKSAFALALAHRINGEIINADMGQLYGPFGIGTAKPSVDQQEGVPHWLYGCIDEPVDYSGPTYRAAVIEQVAAIRARARVPIIVGGSGFYCMSLLSTATPLHTRDSLAVPVGAESIEGSDVQWDTLARIDPVRAKAIHPNDTYRIARAIAVWHATRTLPSAYQPIYSPIGEYTVIHLTADRPVLIERITQRTRAMLAHGWIEECVQLQGTAWQPFIERKGLIGYETVFESLRSNGPIDAEALVHTIAQKTAAYAKRQETYARMLIKKIGSWGGDAQVFNLTLSDIDLYLNQLVSLIQLKR